MSVLSVSRFVAAPALLLCLFTIRFPPVAEQRLFARVIRTEVWSDGVTGGTTDTGTSVSSYAR
eukprot:2457192-Rhodomonas_salina.1